MENRQLWASIGRQAISFIVGVVVAAFLLGRNAQKINDVVEWKKHIAPVIDRMDHTGTLSFDHFHDTYLRDQAKMERRVEKLEEKDP